jgi:hypothetical protein
MKYTNFLCGFSIEEDFVTWREKFWPAVCEHFGVQATGDQVRSVMVECCKGSQYQFDFYCLKH